PEGFDVLALELSSFQLHWTEHLDCEAAVVLNVSADHLDWHGGAEAYAAAKGRIYEGVRTACVYNVADPVTRSLVEEADVVEGARAPALPPGPPGLPEAGGSRGCWWTGRSSPSGARPRQSSPPSTTSPTWARRGPERTSCSTRWPPPPSHAPTGSSPARSATGCGPTGWARTGRSTSPPSTASTTWTTPRRPTPPPRPPPCGPPSAWSGSPAATPRAPTSTSCSQRCATG